jgi:hypothetical protein
MKMKFEILIFLVFIIVLNAIHLLSAQCAGSSAIYSFVYDGKTYEVVKENKTWEEAAACAAERGGYLAEINSQKEQDAVFSRLIGGAGIEIAKTAAQDGGGASYVWLGGNDIAEEGKWILDGNNDGRGPQFWQGLVDGAAVGRLYNNWGHEPDNWNDIQDALAIALTEWPKGSGSLGKAGQWNELNKNDTLYFLIEYDSLKN